MANRLYNNPIFLDSFDSPIDVGYVLIGRTNVPFSVLRIEYSGQGTAVITDAFGTTIFETQGDASESYEGIVQGIRVAEGGVTEGVIRIYLGVKE